MFYNVFCFTFRKFQYTFRKFHLRKLNGLTTFYINLLATTFMTENHPLSAINECAIDCAV